MDNTLNNNVNMSHQHQKALNFNICVTCNWLFVRSVPQKYAEVWLSFHDRRTHWDYYLMWLRLHYDDATVTALGRVVSVPNKPILCGACNMACLFTITSLNPLLLEFMNGMEIVWMMITRKCLGRAAHNKLLDFSILLWQINFTCCLKSLLNQQTGHVLVFLM
jgi:hypothetical protein